MHLVLWGKNLHFVISGYFVISDLVITGVYCVYKITLSWHFSRNLGIRNTVLTNSQILICLCLLLLFVFTL